MIVSIIQDGEGNYVSDMAFQKEERNSDTWLYVCYTGRCDGMRYYTDLVLANTVLHRLEAKKASIGVHKSFTIIEVDKNNLPFGAMRVVNL